MENDPALIKTIPSDVVDFLYHQLFTHSLSRFELMLLNGLYHSFNEVYIVGSGGIALSLNKVNESDIDIVCVDPSFDTTKLMQAIDVLIKHHSRVEIINPVMSTNRFGGIKIRSRPGVEIDIWNVSSIIEYMEGLPFNIYGTCYDLKNDTFIEMPYFRKNITEKIIEVHDNRSWSTISVGLLCKLPRLSENFDFQIQGDLDRYARQQTNNYIGVTQTRS